MKKKMLLIPLVSLLALSLVAVGCAAPAPAPAPAPAVKVIKWIGQCENPAVSPNFISFERASKKITEASGGRLVIESHPGDAIVPADTELDGLNKGTLDIAHNACITWKGTFPASPLFGTTVAGPTALQYYFWYMWGEGFDLMQEMFDSKGYNVMPVAADARVPEIFLYSSVPLNTVDDLKGLKMRLLGDEATIFGKLDVGAVATPSGEIYEAMQRGVIDGFQHASLAEDWVMAFQEICDYAYVSPARQPTDVFVYYVNKGSWAELPSDLKLLVEEMYWNEGIRHYAEWTYKNTEAAATWIDYGVVVEPISSEIEDAVTASALEFYAEQAAKDPFYAKVYDSLLKWRDAYSNTYPRL